MNYPLFYKEVVMIRKAVVEDLPYIKEIYNDAVRNTTASFDITEKGDDFFRTMFDESIVAREFFMFMKKITKQLPMLHFQNSVIEMPMIQQ